MMCDLCIPGTGDHDKPYRFNDLRGMLTRFTRGERHSLILLKTHVGDVRRGYEHGPAAGDVAPDQATVIDPTTEDPDAA